MLHRSSPKSTVLLVALAMAACGGADAPPAAEQPEIASDTLIRPMAREPLTEADLAGLAMADLSLELPWTTNRVNRDPGPAAPKAAVQRVELSEHDDFDRVIFAFSESTPFPGYQIDWVEAGSTLTCAGEEVPIGVSGERIVRVAISPARASAHGEVWVPVRTRDHGQARVGEAGIVCDDDEGVTWAGGVTGVTHLRAFEMRSPYRLVIDVR